MSINRCDLCYELIVDACQASYTFPTGLSSQTYTMVLEDIHGNIFTEINIPDEGGNWTIHASMYPIGMFNEYSGTYEVYFVEGSGDIGDPNVPLYINETEYQCIKIKIKNATLIYD